MTQRSVWLAVALGGALGGLARTGLDSDILTGGDANLWVTVVVNLTGAAVLGVVMGHGTPAWSPPLQAGITTGFLGSFTTFSAIMAGWLSLTLFTDPLGGLLYITATFIGGGFAAFTGLKLGRRWRETTALKGSSS